jgi:hypothetical protein
MKRQPKGTAAKWKEWLKKTTTCERCLAPIEKDGWSKYCANCERELAKLAPLLEAGR